jgi:hypothetical protein
LVLSPSGEERKHALCLILPGEGTEVLPGLPFIDLWGPARVHYPELQDNITGEDPWSRPPATGTASGKWPLAIRTLTRGTLTNVICMLCVC